MTAPRPAIPLDWIERYIEQLNAVATRVTDSGLKASLLLRAEFARDIVQAWRESPFRPEIDGK